MSIPNEPGVYWVCTRGSKTWNAIVRISGTAPFLQTELCAVLEPPHRLKERMYVTVDVPDGVIFGPLVVPPQTSVPKIPDDWMDGWVEQHKSYRSASEARAAGVH